MIIAIAVLFLLVALFWLSISLNKLNQEVYAGKKTEAVLLVSMLSESPEFNCADPGKSLCVDTDKIITLKLHPHYANFWGVDGLQVKKVYPYENKTVECTLGNYPRCNTFTIIAPSTGEIEDSSYASLCRKEYKNGYMYDECELGKISVFTRKTA